MLILSRVLNPSSSILFEKNIFLLTASQSAGRVEKREGDFTGKKHTSEKRKENIFVCLHI
jgi:hypothetical protein